jgi:hypothetical protein
MSIKVLGAKINWLASAFEFGQLWDIRQPVETLAEDTVRIRYQEMTTEDIEDFMCAAVTVIFSVNQWGCYSYLYIWVVCTSVQ